MRPPRTLLEELPEDERRLVEPPMGRDEPDEPLELDEEPIVDPPLERIVDVLPQLPELRGRVACRPPPSVVVTDVPRPYTEPDPFTLEPCSPYGRIVRATVGS